MVMAQLLTVPPGTSVALSAGSGHIKVHAKRPSTARARSGAESVSTGFSSSRTAEGQHREAAAGRCGKAEKRNPKRPSHAPPAARAARVEAPPLSPAPVRPRPPGSKQTLLDLVPVTEPQDLDLDIPRLRGGSPSEPAAVDLLVVGAGPAGLAVAQQVSAGGLRVCCVDPRPSSVWPNNYGVWVDEFEALGLAGCLDYTWRTAAVFLDERGGGKTLDRPYGRVDRARLKTTMMERCIANGVEFHEAKVTGVEHGREWSAVRCDDGTRLRARLVLDATGFSRRLVEYDRSFNPGYQAAWGILAEVESHPFDVDKMLFMDWRDEHLAHDAELRARNRALPTFLYAMPLSPTRIFLEETSLVARPAVPFPEIQLRLEARLQHLGIRVLSIEEDEYCLIPMGGVLPRVPQRVLGIGGTAGMVHPSTGYMVARTLAAAPALAKAIVERLGGGDERGTAAPLPPADELAKDVWAEIWPRERMDQRDFFCFGMDVLLKLDLHGTRRFFDAFFDLSPRHWQGFLSSRLYLGELVQFGLSLFAHATNVARLEIMAKGTPGLGVLLKNLVETRIRRR